MSTLSCRPVTPEQRAGYIDFFDRRAFADNPRWAGCFCHFPLHDPAGKGWQLYSPEENRAAVAGRIMAGTMPGYLAYADGAVVGWCNAGPWTAYPMLQQLDEPDAGMLAYVFCFVVAPDWRGKGVATALLAGATDDLRARGLTAIAAAPHKDSRDAADNHHGPLSLYLKAGFTVARDLDEHRVIVRKAL